MLLSCLQSRRKFALLQILPIATIVDAGWAQKWAQPHGVHPYSETRYCLRPVPNGIRDSSKRIPIFSPDDLLVPNCVCQLMSIPDKFANGWPSCVCSFVYWAWSHLVHASFWPAKPGILPGHRDRLIVAAETNVGSVAIANLDRLVFP